MLNTSQDLGSGGAGFNVDRHRNIDDIENQLGERLCIGDAILLGGSDPVSRFIQFGTRSPYSHMAIVTGHRQLIEAYDYALTPDESDEGIYRLSLSELITRSDKTSRIRVLRPAGIDQGRLVAAADYLLTHSPGFPTVAAAFIAMCGLSVPFLKALPSDTRQRLALWQARMAADGVNRLHCAETATRIYNEAGLQVRFNAPRLEYHIQHLDRWRGTDQLIGLPTIERTAVKGHWPKGLRPTNVASMFSTAVGDTVRTARERARSTAAVDRADLVMPGDFARAEPFTDIGEFVRTRHGWAAAA
ncbi:MAG: hypothetical protein ACRBK7_08980 [Acidimicrobiales bacterium]